jgi:hypothetical protein
MDTKYKTGPSTMPRARGCSRQEAQSLYSEM